jgi:D-alanyl-D-alanine carboxypeptidase
MTGPFKFDLPSRPSRKLIPFGLAVGLMSLSGPVANGTVLETQVDSYLQQCYAQAGPGAAVLVRSGDQTLLRKGYGLADLGHQVPLAPDRVFRIGSITKQFTAVSILQLVAAGKLRLDDDVVQYVPDFPNQGRRITIAQLLSHTSGIPNYTAQANFRSAPQRDLTLRQIFGLIKGRPFNFEPGTDWAYCNTGYVLLGAVIEKVSGQSYASYLQKHIIEPAGLTHTTYGFSPQGVPAQVPGYSRTYGGTWMAAVDLNATQAYAAGALMSDVDDLLKWERALESGRIVRRDLLAQAQSPVRLTSGQWAPGYGFGWELTRVDGYAAAGHGGTISGFRSYELSIPETGLFVAILCNCDRPTFDPQDVALKIARMVTEKPLPALAAAFGPNG